MKFSENGISKALLDAVNEVNNETIKQLHEEDLHELHGKGDLEKIRDYHSDKAIQYYGRASTMRKNKGSFEKSQSLDNVGKAHSSQNARARYNIQKRDEKKVVKEGTSKADNQWGWDPGRERAPEHRGLEDQNRDYYKRQKLEAKERAKKLAAKRREEPNLPFGKPLKRFAAGTYKLKEEEQLDETPVTKPRKLQGPAPKGTYAYDKRHGKYKELNKKYGDPNKKPKVVVGSAEWKKLNEETQLDEIFKKTLGSYIKKASHDVATKSAVTRGFARDADDAHDKQDFMAARNFSRLSNKMFNKSWNRRKGIARATDRLMKD